MTRRKSFSKWITTNFQLEVRDGENLATISSIKLNYLKITFIVLSVFIVFTFFSFMLITSALSRWFDPRSKYMEVNRQVVELVEAVDSLEYEMYAKDQYIENIKSIVFGQTPIPETGDLETENQKINTADIDLLSIHPVDSQFRMQFTSDIYIDGYSEDADRLQGLFLFPPTSGVVTRKYDANKGHFGTDIVSKKNEPVKSVADGTVILSSWTQDGGYVLTVQHENQLISVYKHNAVLYKNVGDVVRSGDIVGVVGNTGEFTDGPHLHLELWHKGNPINPEDFIFFK